MNDKQQLVLEKIAARLTELRKEKGLSQRQLAARCDVDSSKINKIERRKANLWITTLVELAHGLEVHPREFLDIEF